MHKIVRIMILISFLMAATNALAEEGNKKYQFLFYPSGMPVKEGWFGTGPTVYEYYGKAEIPATNLLFILYSEKIQTSRISDNEYTAFLAVINKNGTNLSILNIYNVTKYITVQMEIEGGLAEMGGLLDIFPIKDDVYALHLNLTGRLSGSGSVLSESDVFFLADSTNNSSSPILELLDTAVFGRSGVGKSKYSFTSIYTLNNEQTGTQILTQAYNYIEDQANNIDQGILSPDINVYQYDFTNKKYFLINTIAQLPAGATKLKRTVELNTTPCSGDCQ